MINLQKRVFAKAVLRLEDEAAVSRNKRGGYVDGKRKKAP